MRPVTAAFLDKVQSSHRAVVEATVFAPDGSVTPLEVISGSVTLETQSLIRGRLDLTLQGAEWVPVDPYGNLAPYGAEINVKRGVELDDGTVELVSLGWFRIEEVTVEDSGDSLSTTVTGLDRAQRVSDAKFIDTYQYPDSSVTVPQFILDTIQAVWPDVPYQPDFLSQSSVSFSNLENKLAAQMGDDRWEFCHGMALALGMSLFFDGDGVLTLKRYAHSSPVMDLSEGDGGVLLQVSRSWTRTNSFNQVVATGENPDNATVYRGEATDLNPSSPTYFYGPFGQVPTFYDSPHIVSDEQAEDAANTKLALEIGTPASVGFGIVPNPALEPDDTVRITRERTGIDADFVLDSVTIGLGADESMSGTTRELPVR